MGERLPSEGHVLAVDDEPQGLTLLRRTFASDPKIRFTGVTSPHTALELAAAQPVDVVIADQRMPGMSGVDLLVALREIRPEAIGIILTAYPELSVAIRAINEGQIFRFLTKPCDPSELRLTVKQALQMVALRRENEQLTQDLQRQNAELQSAIARIRTAQEDLIRSEKMAAVGRLSAGLAHELANPVTAILHQQRIMSTKLLGSGAFSELAPSLSVVERAIGTIRNLVQALRSYSHPGERRPAPWDVNEGIELSLQLLEHRFKGRINVVREYHEVPPVTCFGQEIGQVLLNLLANAADALEGRPEPELRVRTERQGEEVLIDVSDTGVGMDADTQAQVFEPFFTTKPVGVGTGLGLSICRQIIESHRGRLEIESQRGRGTRVTVSLPVVPPSTSGVGPVPATPPS